MSYPADPYGQSPGFTDPYAQPQFGQPRTGYTQPQTSYAQPQTGYAQPMAGYAQPGYGYQPAGSANLPVASYGQTLVTIGSIMVTDTEVITPSGRIPLAQAQFGFIDQTMRVRKTPTWAVVMAIVGFFIVTIFSLLFLLAKEDAMTGNVLVTVTGGGLQHQEFIAVNQEWQLQDLYGRVQYAQNTVRAHQG